ncbi:amidohydrolase family protein [Streptomyces sp. NPDC005574]|uniref:amidohydrolase family protein n=1 Tax=Streptomyces sp. NPDC005574 TaxID=3156891 RepID=UPI0033A07110
MSGTRIDVHTHYFGGSVSTLQTRPGTAPMRWNSQQALAFMDRQGIAAQLLSLPFTPVGTPYDPDFAVRFSRTVNREYADLADHHPGRFGAFAALPGDCPETMLAEIEYALDTLGLDGVMLSSNTRGHYLGAPFLEPVLAELNRRRTPVLIHPTGSPHVTELALGRPPSVVEFPFDTARNITNAIYTGVFQRYPDLRLILPHCGGPLPALGQRIAEHTIVAMGPDDADIGPDHVAAVLRGLYYDTAMAGTRNCLLPALEVTSSDRILFGTDWPPAPESTVTRNTANLTGFGFTPDELFGIERGNALQLFPRLR